MRWLRAAPLVILLASAEWAAPGCSNGDDSSQVGSIADASQPIPTRFEAGSNCSSSADCEDGLACLFPASACNTLKVCVAAPWFSEAGACDQPQPACSCLGEVIEICHGYGESPVDVTTTCDGGTAIVPMDAGLDAIAPAPDAGGLDAAPDASVGAGDAGDVSDASASAD